MTLENGGMEDQDESPDDNSFWQGDFAPRLEHPE